MKTDPSHDAPHCEIKLRPVVEEDLRALYGIQLQPRANEMAVANPRDWDEFLSHWRGVLDDSEVVARAVLHDGRLVGSISCFRLDGLDAVGYWLSETCWGRGIATRALGLLVIEVTRRPLWAIVATSNTASIRVLEKCGFQAVEYRRSVGTDRFPACEEVLMRLAP